MDKIVTGIGRPDTKEIRMSISGQLGRYVRRGDVFKRVGPNEFSLIGLDVMPELPSDFGVDDVQDADDVSGDEVSDIPF